MNYCGFTTIPLPETPNIIYIVGLDTETGFCPFYVGESGRNIGRLGDYVSAQFTASTDFNVGQAAKYFAAKGFRVAVFYKPMATRNAAKQLQDEYVKRLRANGAMLLNG